jgi:hypothetical protein
MNCENEIIKCYKVSSLKHNAISIDEDDYLTGKWWG